MTERPILFSGPMVRAILDGRKTQTRRLVKIPRHVGNDIQIDPAGRLSYSACVCSAPGQEAFETWTHQLRSPYGQPGDRLWVRETWGSSLLTPTPGTIYYRADGNTLVERWRPSIHMPRWASRLSLEVTSVRVERLQNISEEDALAEGIREDGEPWASEYGWGVADRRVWAANTARQRFEYAWDRINGDRVAWASNPWVWCVGFKRVEAADAHR